MGRISDKLAAAAAHGDTTVSFEFFPPKSFETVNLLLRNVESMVANLNPTFVTLTWRSAFEDESLWLQVGSTIQREFHVDVLLHLTCHLPVEDLRRVLRNAREAGIQNILALRGDPPLGQERWQPQDGCLRNAVELVRLIREEHGDYFCIAVAAYSEVHTESWNCAQLPPSEQAKALDLARIKDKVDAGADLIITQFFFDVDILLDFVRRARDAGIGIPILPGYLPIQTYRSFKKFTVWCKTAVPPPLLASVEAARNDEAQMRALGVKEAVSVCRRLLAEMPQKCLHFYTMNQAATVTRILEELELTPKTHMRIAPWQRHGREGAKLQADEVRPIFWSNRHTSYQARTHEWPRQPSSRWGEAPRPSYGPLSEYHMEFKRPKVDRTDMWGLPASEDDVTSIFVGFMQGEVELLPWCEQTPSRETKRISGNLLLLNKHGFLTINSQPRVDGALSTDPEVGWGGPDGYVFQRAYVEFFCSPKNLEALMRVMDEFPTLSFMAVNATGSASHSNCGDEPNAVTWGVFPDREIVQPTVFDPVSFGSGWREEAFGLWITQWKSAYPEGSVSASVIQGIHDTWYLVGIVDNDYCDGSDVFAVFKRAITDSMDEAALRERVMTVEVENDRLRESLDSVSAAHVETQRELARLRKLLGEMRMEEELQAARGHPGH